MSLTKEQLLGLVRHTLSFIGGILIAYSMVNPGMMNVILGSASTITSVIWSIMQKRPLTEIITNVSVEENPKPTTQVAPVKSTPKIVAKPKPTKKEFPITEETPDRPKPKKKYYKKKERKPIH